MDGTDTNLPRVIPSPRPHYTLRIHGNDELGSAGQVHNLPVVNARHHHRPFLQHKTRLKNFMCKQTGPVNDYGDFCDHRYPRFVGPMVPPF